MKESLTPGKTRGILRVDIKVNLGYRHSDVIAAVLLTVVIMRNSFKVITIQFNSV